MSSVTVQELNDLVALIKEKEDFYDVEKAKVTELGKEIDSLYAKATLFLDELDQTSFKTPQGTIIISEKRSVKIPGSDEEKQALFEWLRERGIFDRYATVNSQSLNSLYNTEYVEAEKRGEDMMVWSIPGVGEAKTFRTTSIRKK